MKKILVLILGLCLASSAWGISAYKSKLYKPGFKSTYYSPTDELSDYIKGVVGEEYIRGMWFFDTQKGKNVVEDRGPRNHKITLTGALALFNPSNKGLLNTISCVLASATGRWIVDDNDDFSFGNGITDKPFSVVIFISPTDLSGNGTGFSIGKNNTAQTQMEWILWSSAQKIKFSLTSLDVNKYIGRYYNTSLAGDIGSWHCYTGTYNGSSLVGGLKVYRDGIRIDDTGDDTLNYVAMSNGTGQLSSTTWSANYSGDKYAFAMVVARELDPSEVKKISDCLLAASRGSLWLK